MKNLNSKIFDNYRKRNQKKIYIILFLFLLLVLLSYLIYKNETKELPKLVMMSDLIKEEKNEEEIYAYIDVVTKPVLFASYEEDGKEDNDKYYLVMDKNNYLYVVYMDDDLYNKLNIDDITINPIKISGLTKSINRDIKDAAIKAYNVLMKDEYLTLDNFKNYSGLVYLDTTINLKDSTIYIIMMTIISFIFIVYLIIYFKNIIKNKKLLTKIEIFELEKIASELFEQTNSKYSNMYLYLLKKFVVDLNKNIVIIAYDDIKQANIVEKNYNGTIFQSIKIITVNNKKYEIATSKIENKEKKLQEILKIIKENSKNII